MKDSDPDWFGGKDSLLSKNGAEALVDVWKLGRSTLSFAFGWLQI